MSKIKNKIISYIISLIIHQLEQKFFDDLEDGIVSRVEENFETALQAKVDEVTDVLSNCENLKEECYDFKTDCESDKGDCQEERELCEKEFYKCKDEASKCEKAKFRNKVYLNRCEEIKKEIEKLYVEIKYNSKKTLKKLKEV